METFARQQFLKDYATVRLAEGRGSEDPAYYRALPYRDLTGNNAGQWAIRGRTYSYFERRILPALERAARRPLDVLDLGAGTGWLSYRLTLRGHHPVALDIFTDPKDGLHATRHYEPSFPCIEAEFDRLPVAGAAFDVAIYNASFHYSEDYRRTLAEVRRCLRPSGCVLIMDSPVYRRREDGARMVEERHSFFEKQYGFRSDAIASREFLDEPLLDELSRDLRLTWRIWRPWYGWQWALRPIRAKLAGRRPPSRFWILQGRFQ
ncbi:MAG TPA: class I SAM-dependent methyltransferase [Bryobacteraceae bacterium]